MTPKTIGELIAIDQITSETLFVVEKDGVTYKAPYSEIAVANYTSILYADLLIAYNGGTLIPGMFYLITDFETCYDRPNYDSNGNTVTTGNYVASGTIEPLLVLATSATTLAAEAYSLTYPKDKIKYDITFNTTEVTTGVAKGRITERIDERNNRTDYDFRNVEFIRYQGYFCETLQPGTVSISGTTVTGVDTQFTSNFSTGDVLAVRNQGAQISGFYFYEITDVVDDTTMNIAGVNVWSETNVRYSRGISLGNKSPFPSNIPSTTANFSLYNTFNDSNNYSNYIGDNLGYDTFMLSNNVFLSGTYSHNKFGSNCIGNTFDDDMDSNTIGSFCQFNIITNDFDRNTVGSYMEGNIIECDMESNRIGNYFQRNMLGDDDGSDFDFNLIGENFRNNFFTMSNGSFMKNTIGRSFDGNIINDVFENNTTIGTFTNNIITNTFADNTMGNNVDSNLIYDTFINNSIGANFYQNTIDTNGAGFRYNAIQNDFYGNNIEGGFQYNKIGAYFYQNTIKDGFGTDGNPRGNVIGNYFYDNNIGISFLGNHIADNFNNCQIFDNFKYNKVDANDLSNINFKEKVNSIATVSVNIGESTYVDGVYNVYQTANYSNSEGMGAQFEVTVSGGSITNIVVTNGGNLYGTYNIIGISADQIPGSTQDLTLVVNTLTQMPLVYQLTNSTISRAFDTVNGEILMISALYNTSSINGLYISTDYKGPITLA
jgi:hypothetical protein